MFYRLHILNYAIKVDIYICKTEFCKLCEQITSNRRKLEFVCKLLKLKKLIITNICQCIKANKWWGCGYISHSHKKNNLLIKLKKKKYFYASVVVSKSETWTFKNVNVELFKLRVPPSGGTTISSVGGSAKKIILPFDRWWLFLWFLLYRNMGNVPVFIE